MKKLGLICALGALSISLSSCLFDTREAEPPDDTGDDAVVLDDALAPFEALTRSLESLTDANYERATSQSFVFSPTQQDSMDDDFLGDPVYVGWNKQVEMDVVGLLISDADTIQVDFRPTPKGGTTVFQRFEVAYTLRVVNVAGTTVYEGLANFDHRNEGGNWRLTFWDELNPLSSNPTWGYLRGRLRQQLNP